jgi:hypothetical protein
MLAVVRGRCGHRGSGRSRGTVGGGLRRHGRRRRFSVARRSEFQLGRCIDGRRNGGQQSNFDRQLGVAVGGSREIIGVEFSVVAGEFAANFDSFGADDADGHRGGLQ